MLNFCLVGKSRPCKLMLNLKTLNFKVLVFNFMYCKVCKSRVLLISSRVLDMVGARGGESNLRLILERHGLLVL